MEKEVFLKAKNIFEKRFNCSLCRHDYERKANLELLPDYHLNPFCTGVKKSEHAIHVKCIQFDQNLLQQQLLRSKKTLFKRCPAGFIECVFPIFRDGHLAGCLFAGPFSDRKKPPEMEISADWKLDREPDKLPPELPDDLDEFLAWGELLAASLLVVDSRRRDLPGSVKELIHEFLKNNYQKNIGLNDIAELLSLTSARASDRIQREFGQRFCVLLKKYRLEAACKLLENSGFSVEDIARRSGFKSGAYFHRVFHREFNITPQEYRQKNRKNDV